MHGNATVDHADRNSADIISGPNRGAARRQQTVTRRLEYMIIVDLTFGCDSLEPCQAFADIVTGRRREYHEAN
ncbi:hypothetical protein [Sphingomonas oligophenolica]|uniref:hypothetical protein n=1 Tax=Sphingomonas oligophenolica TaxID=301154 RepID=UPI0031F53874